MMTTFTIALLQMMHHGLDQEANASKGELFCRQAKAMGADLALFPEMWNIGYCISDEYTDTWLNQAIASDSPFVNRFRVLAQELDIAIAITYMEAWEGAPRNTVSVIDRHGDIVLTYAKVHTCDFSSEGCLTPGDGFHVADLDTPNGTITLGAMICYDREFPESARALMLQGAEIILVPNSCNLERHRLRQFETRAYENMVGLAMTNYPMPHTNGHSVAYDPIAFDGIDGPSRDMLIVEAGEQEGIFLAPFDMVRIREYRQEESWGNAYRKPYAYNDLVSTHVAPPFIRADARR